MRRIGRTFGILLFVVILCVFSGCKHKETMITSESTAISATEMTVTEPAPKAKKPTPYRPEPRPDPTEPTEHPLKAAYKENKAAFVVFDSAKTQYVYVPVQEIMEYESLYPDCNETWFRDQLSGEDLCIYNSFLYAMEHCCTWFELYVEDNDKDFYYVREALSLDSPFLEQNANRYDRFYANPTDYVGESISFSIPSFAEERWSMKMEALEKCREIVSNMPSEYSTQTEKAKYLYRYVCDNMKYVSYKNMADNDYLYDAVCKGESICDGYSNMLNLLFNLAGIDSCEAMGYSIEDVSTATEEELRNAFGHTWVVAQLDGQYYNFDTTWEDSKKRNVAIESDIFCIFRCVDICEIYRA